MKIVHYTTEYKEHCLSVFRSNIGPFFVLDELSRYEAYLRVHALNLAYFVVLKKNDVVGCGGYAKKDTITTLSWGMVERSHHGESIGKQLLLYRLKAIYNDFGNVPLSIDTSQQTQGFYQKYGFIPTKVEPDGYGKGIDKVYMEYHGDYLQT